MNKNQDSINIIMCCWKRIENLETQLKNMNEQTIANKIILHLLNNNPEYSDLLTQKINSYFNTFSNINIKLSHYCNQYLGFQRFLYIRDILIKSGIEYVIMIDDDQIFSSDWVEKLYSKREPKTYYAWYVKKWNKSNIDYWKGNILNKNTNPDELCHYGGTGGSLVDTSIFEPNSELWNIPKEHNICLMEDLWLSFVVINHYGWQVKYSGLPIKESLNYEGSSSKNNESYLRSIKEKQMFLKYLSLNFDNYIK